MALAAFWTLRGYSSEGRKTVRAALALPAIQGADIARAHALYVGAALATSQSDHAEAGVMLEACLVLRRRLGNRVEIAATLSTLSLARLQAGDARVAGECEREALEIFRLLGDRLGEAIGLLHLGQIALYLGDDDLAQSCLESGLQIARELAHREIEGECALVLGQVAFERGDMAQAADRLNQSLVVCHEAGDKRGQAHAQWWLGKLELVRGELGPASRLLVPALQAFRAFEMREELLGCIEDHALLAQLQGLPEQAVHLAAAAAMSRQRLELGHAPRAALRRQAQLDAMRAAMPGEPFEVAWNVGRRWEIDDAVRCAAALAAPEAQR